MRWEDIDAYVLHTYPYKETSLIVEAFTATLGRVALVAKGAKRPASALRGLLQPFLPLTLAFTGKSEMKTLTRAEWQPGTPLLTGNAVMVGYYLNELVLKLLARDDAHPALYAAYASTVSTLAAQRDTSVALRSFELKLLAELGYGVNLERCADTDAPISANGLYAWQPDRGVLAQGPASLPSVRGATLLGLVEGRFANTAEANDAKRFMRVVLDYHLERRALASRQLMRDVLALTEKAKL
jgi:DNA repair protein RecO (recombination protein O)